MVSSVAYSLKFQHKLRSAMVTVSKVLGIWWASLYLGITQCHDIHVPTFQALGGHKLSNNFIGHHQNGHGDLDIDISCGLQVDGHLKKIEA